MFLALDECFAGSTAVIGCVSIPRSIFSSLESNALNVRIEHRLWGEMKWNKISSPSYAEKYKTFVATIMANEQVTYHSWAYNRNLPILERRRIHQTSDKQKIFYRQCYALIRSVVKKCMAEGIFDFYIVADETGPLGTAEYKIIKEYLEKDRRFPIKPRLQFCSTGNSAVSASLQVADIVTGALTSKLYSGSELSDSHLVVFNYIESLNDGLPLGITPVSAGALSDMKFHHCNITEYYSRM